MATEKKFRYKHILSNVEDKAPTSEQLLEGEIAVNKFAGKEKLFIKNSSGNIVSFSSDQVIDSMISDSISGKSDTSAVTESINAATSGKLDTSAFETYSGNVDTEIGSKASQSDLSTLSGTVTGHTADTDIHLTTTEKTNLDSLATNIAAISGVSSSDVTNWNSKTDNVGTVTNVGISLPNALSASTTAVTTSGTFDVSLSSGYTIPTTAEETSWNGAVTNLGGFKLVEITQSDYDNLPTPRDSKTLYIIRN